MINIHIDDALGSLLRMPSNSIDCTVSSPPYNIGKEYERRVGIDLYVKWIEPVLAEIMRVTKPGGSICWQVGSHITRTPCDCGDRKSVAEVLPLDFLFYPLFRKHGALLRQRIIWQFGHGLHAKYRFSGRHETILWFTKGEPAYDVGGVRHAMDDVWQITNVKNNHREKIAHPCQFPEELVERLLVHLTMRGDHILDPFAGVGTVGVVAERMRCRATLIELDREYAEMARARISARAAPGTQVILRAA